MQFTRRACAAIAATLCTALLSMSHGAWAETTLKKIRRTGTVTVGTEAAYPPFEFVQNGKIVGYGSDILAEVIKELNAKLVQMDLPFQGILPGVLAGKFDFVATTVGIIKERAKRYAYTLPIADGTPYLLDRKGESLKASDLNGKVVATQLTSATEPVARALDTKLKAAGGSGFKQLKLYTSFPETYVALSNGEVDTVLEPLPNLTVVVKQHPDEFSLGGRVHLDGTYTYLAWVTRPDDKALRDFISGVIRKMRDDGRLGALQKNGSVLK